MTAAEIMADALRQLGVPLDDERFDMELRRAEHDLACDDLAEYVRDGECTVRILIDGIRRDDWEQLPYARTLRFAGPAKVQTVGPHTTIEYAAADNNDSDGGDV